MIFFDIDATLLDHDRAEKMGAIDFFKECKNELEYSENEFVDLRYNLSKKYFEKFLAKEFCLVDIITTKADSKFNNYLELYKRNWSAFEDVIPCLLQLKQQGFRLGIISNGDYGVPSLTLPLVE